MRSPLAGLCLLILTFGSLALAQDANDTIHRIQTSVLGVDAHNNTVPYENADLGNRHLEAGRKRNSCSFLCPLGSNVLSDKTVSAERRPSVYKKCCSKVFSVDEQVLNYL